MIAPEAGRLPLLQTRAALPLGSKLWVAIGAIILICAALVGRFYWRGINVNPGVDNRINTVRVIMRSLASTVTTSGIVRLRTGASVRVGSQVSGIVRKLNVTVGSQIKRGDIIALIDPIQLEARVDQARAQLAMDRVAVAKAERDVARIKTLAATGAIAKQQQEDLSWQLKAAEAKQSKSESDLKAACVELSYATIRAPISGIVSSVSTQEGETVAASFAAPTFVTIVENNALELLAMVDETDIAGVAAGNTVTFTVEAYAQREFSATVQRIDPTATIVAGVVNYPVIAHIQGDLPLLRPDMTANIIIETAQRSSLVIPALAVQNEPEGRFVYRLNDKVIERRQVITGTKEGDLIEIVKGLSANDQVLTSGWPKSMRGRAAP